MKIYKKYKLLDPNRRKSVKREIKLMEKMKHSDLPYDGSGPRGVWDTTLMLACMMPAGQVMIKINS
jgi:hypothetical protein